MSLRIHKYRFDGPYQSMSKIDKKPGVFVVIAKWKERTILIDVDCSDNVRSAIEECDRQELWRQICKSGHLWYAIAYSDSLPNHTRFNVAGDIRRQIDLDF